MTASYTDGILAVATFNIIRSLRIPGYNKQFLRFGVLHKLAHQYEDKLLTGPPCLCHVLSHDQDCVLPTQFPNQFFYGFGTAGIAEQGSSISKTLGFTGNNRALHNCCCSSRDCLVIESVLDLVPKQHVAQGPLDCIVITYFLLLTTIMQPVSEKGSVADGHGQGVRSLKHHAD